jgi:hypothetical protein
LLPDAYPGGANHSAPLKLSKPDMDTPSPPLGFLILQKEKPANRKIFWILENETRISID